MSYILDALRRSQAERERGQVPGLDARPAAVAAVPAGPPGQRLRWAALIAAGAGVAVLVAWWMLRATPPAVPVLPATVRAPDRAPEAVVPPEPAVLPIVVSAPPPPPPAAASTATVRPAPVPAPTPAAAATKADTVPAAPAAASAAPASTLLAALTAAQRRELPPLVLGGSIWSESALARFVIVNGQVVREGEAAAPGVVVERIGPKAVWLRWRELRLEVPL